MTIRVLSRTAIAGFFVLAMSGCQGDFVAPDQSGPDSELYARGPNGPGGGGGGGGGGGKADKGDVYSDLVLALRDADGEFIFAEFMMDGVAYECVQPVSYEQIPGVPEYDGGNPVNEEAVWLVPLMGELLAPPSAEPLAEDGEDEAEMEPCDPQPEYVEYVHEVEIGRLNLGRSPDRVLDAARDEVLAKLNVWKPLYLDHAGRLTNDDLTIDAPRENLALYRELLTNGQIGGYTLPTPSGWTHEYGYGVGQHAASGLGAGSDKAGDVNVDLVWYLNRILGIDYDFSAFEYHRSDLFPGCLSYWDLSDMSNPQVRSGTIMDVVFEGVDLDAANIHGFAMRADDARRVILFAHDQVMIGIDRIGENAFCSAP